MKKVLIWDTFSLANVGGPSGYLYNIHEYLIKHPTPQITFLSDLIKDKGTIPMRMQEGPRGIQKTFLERVKELMRKPHKIFRRIFKTYYRIYDTCFSEFHKVKGQVPEDIDINQFDYVHVHILTHAAQFRMLFPNYRGKLILTSHCPCPWSDEILTYVFDENTIHYKFYNFLLKPFLLRKESQVYKSVDYIMFPCREARECYEKAGKIKKTFAQSEDKFIYVPSAITDYKADIEHCQKLSEFKIPADAFVIAYFGRHIPIKGYDILCKLGKKILDKYPQAYFLCGGVGIIDTPKHPRWLELGFINNVDDLLPQVSLYILPNRETYFDLITLQILCAGVPLILSSTGGNKYFKRLPSNETNGMRFFDIEDEQTLELHVKDIINAKESCMERYKEMRDSNRRLFEKYFTIDKYVEMYLQTIEQL